MGVHWEVLGWTLWNAPGTPLWIRGAPLGIISGPLVGPANHKKTNGFLSISTNGCTHEHLLNTRETHTGSLWTSLCAPWTHWVVK